MFTILRRGGTTERTFHYCWRVKSSFKLVLNRFEWNLAATYWSLLPLVISSRFCFAHACLLGTEELRGTEETPRKEQRVRPLIMNSYFSLKYLFTVHGCNGTQLLKECSKSTATNIFKDQHFRNNCLNHRQNIFRDRFLLRFMVTMYVTVKRENMS